MNFFFFVGTELLKKKYTLYKVHEKNQPYLFFGMMHNAIALQFSQFLIFNILKPTVFTHSLVCYLILKKKDIDLNQKWSNHNLIISVCECKQWKLLALHFFFTNRTGGRVATGRILNRIRFVQSKNF